MVDSWISRFFWCALSSGLLLLSSREMGAAAEANGVAARNSLNLEAVRTEAESGKSPAQCRLAEYFFSRADYANAALWYRRAAEQGEAEAEISLAACYATGRGVNKDLREAGKWSRQAVIHLATLTDAESGKAKAQAKLGDACLARGDHTNAVLWYRKAAEQGEVEAQISLASCYANGRGVAKDLPEAARWSRLAATQIGEPKLAAMAAVSTNTPPLPVPPSPVSTEPVASAQIAAPARIEPPGTEPLPANNAAAAAPPPTPAANPARVQRVAQLQPMEPQVQEPAPVIRP